MRANRFQCTPSQKLDERAVREVFLKVLDNYIKWCRYLRIRLVWNRYFLQHSAIVFIDKYITNFLFNLFPVVWKPLTGIGSFSWFHYTYAYGVKLLMPVFFLNASAIYFIMYVSGYLVLDTLLFVDQNRSFVLKDWCNIYFLKIKKLGQH